MKYSHITRYTLLFLFCLLQIAFAQYREPTFNIHDRGELWETMKDNGQIGGIFSSYQYFPSLDWPGGPAVLPSKDEQRAYMQGAGIWIGGKNPDGSIFFNEMGPFDYVDLGTFYPITEQENFIGSPDYNPNKAEEIITAHWQTTRGIELKRVSRAWSFPAFNDFIIMEYIATNKSNLQLQDVFIGFLYLMRPSYQDVLAHAFWGDNLNIDDELVGYDENLDLFYAYDYTPNSSIMWDWGNFVELKGELRTTGYAGFAPLFSSPATGGLKQPATIFYAQTIGNSQYFTSTSQTAANLYAILNGTNQTWQAPAGEVLSPLMLAGFGPYNLAPGDSVRIVIVEAVNGIPQDLAIKGLSSQSKLSAGLDSLKNTVTRSRQLFDRNYVPTALAPPAPAVEHFVLPSTQEIAITWPPDLENWIDPLTNEADLKIYRVYRSERSYIGPFTRIREIRIDRQTDRSRFFDNELGKWKYKDNAIQVGFGYFYAVTSVDAAGNESGITNRNTTALIPARRPAESALNVKVFPNPFRLVSGLPTAGEETSIIFTNLPEICTIRIYTINGELVRTLEHQNPNSGEEVWNQLTEARQKTAAGIYLWTVESSVGHAKGTLVLIK
ncbi:hypothetical protein JW964_09835 [candidate division KSB1 bacterium]|nr:hypothetical protein [candidate division KSB1 bacterium]